MLRFYSASFLFMALISGQSLPFSALSAQNISGEENSTTIVVTGQAQPEEQVLREAIREMAQRGRSSDRPNAQFQSPLCVSVAGLGEQPGAAVKQRIEANTRDAGFKVAEAVDCEVNALVVVVDDQLALIDQLRKSQPVLFSADIDRRIEAAARRSDAAISWATYRLGDPQGKPLTMPGSLAGAGVTGTETVFTNATDGAAQTRSGGISRATIPFSSEKVFSVVVFDVRRLIGAHLDQVADYATMQILADPQPGVTLNEGSANSILTLFEGSPEEAPQNLTDIDRAFLRGLYAMRPNDPANQLERFVISAYEDIAAGNSRNMPGREPSDEP